MVVSTLGIIGSLGVIFGPEDEVAIEEPNINNNIEGIANELQYRPLNKVVLGVNIIVIGFMIFICL